MRLTAEEREQALAFRLIVAGRGCQLHDDPLECEPPIQAAHILSKQALRRRGLHRHVYDPRNGIGACYKAHRRSDAGLERFPADRIPADAREFARELNLEHLLDRYYGVGA